MTRRIKLEPIPRRGAWQLPAAINGSQFGDIFAKTNARVSRLRRRWVTLWRLIAVFLSTGAMPDGHRSLKSTQN